MKMYIAYLAGPITGVSFDDSVDWRDEMISLLPDEIQGMSPLRCGPFTATVQFARSSSQMESRTKNYLNLTWIS